MPKNHTKCFLLFAAVFCLCSCAMLNQYQKDGQIVLSGLDAPVTVTRDEKGMAYLHARSLDDALAAQGFVTAQDRLFQMELMRLLTSGRISELIGDKGIPIDRQIRTIGFVRHARKHAKILSTETLHYFEQYLKGINAYIAEHGDTHHLEFKLAGLSPSPWRVEDSLAILYYMSWMTSANIKTEMTTQMLIETVGLEKASKIFPLNIHPEDAPEPSPHIASAVDNYSVADQIDIPLPGYSALSFPASPLRIGSNNWVTNGKRSQSGKPTLANDPHLDARILPGPWYPCGLITPDLRIVGVGIAGIPGMIIFRNSHVAVGVTNAYADSQDLYVETPDPENPDYYLEGDQKFPFETIPETIKVKDGDAPEGFREEPFTIRSTHRGPVISGIFKGLLSDKLITMRWAALETMAPVIGLERVLTACSAAEVCSALADINMIMLNVVFADNAGNIGWQTTGKLPIREQQDGTVPVVVTDSHDNWTGWIPSDQMPGVINPPAGWVGTANHRTVGEDYPYYYSSYFSPVFRYQRIRELIDSAPVHSADDFWQYQLDTKNLMAAEIKPIILNAVKDCPEASSIVEILAGWNCHDDIDTPAPTIFHEIYQNFALLVFQDELGPDPARAMLDCWYFWQERLHRMILQNDSRWFDNTATPDRIETRDILFCEAARTAVKNLEERYGGDPEDWLWGKAHQLELVSPVRREGVGKGLLGGGRHPAPGSVETLQRGIYSFNKPFDVTVSASLRMVVDLGDTDKMLAVIPGGVAGRIFHPHATDQIEKFMQGEKTYWWFSDAAIDAHAQSQLTLNPEKR